MEHPPSFDDGRPEFDHVLAKEIQGKHILVGITYVDKRGEFKSQEQVHGHITNVDPRSGFTMTLLGVRKGEEYCLPPDTRAFERASPGEYKLKATGEVVVNPDYTATWTVEEPDA